MGEVISLNFRPKNIHTEFKESRFKGGHICIHCGPLIVVKNGKSNGSSAISGRIVIGHSMI